MKKLIAFAALGAAVVVVGTTSAALAHTTAKKASIDVGVLLPDTKSSVRWQTQDAPDLAKAFKAAGLSASVVNAQNSATTQKTQADAAIANGAKVLLLVNLDSASGAAIEADAARQGVKVIDYDRLTLGGSASYYVSFNNVTVGQLQGKGLVSCLKASGEYGKKPVVAELNGAPTDNNATLFAQGYNSVLNPLYKNGTFKKGPNQSVPDWDNQKALTIFEGMLSKTSNNIQAVASANDGLGNAVVQAIKNHKLSAIPVTGQDATAQGIQNILSGYQCMTVYKAVPLEAAAAAKLAISLIKGGKPAGINSSTSNGKKKVPSVLLTPMAITKSNYKILFTQKYLKKSDVCNGAYAKLCK
ncbi:MAG TPA: substrate-binding domain-containing protein [Solirubrobacteraceae bacterium]|nr:substrate-binding domain-containing protein [Solirubrobacteraceae bacterium]